MTLEDAQKKKKIGERQIYSSSLHKKKARKENNSTRLQI